jgi:hypothetical protein
MVSMSWHAGTSYTQWGQHPVFVCLLPTAYCLLVCRLESDTQERSLLIVTDQRVQVVVPGLCVCVGVCVCVNVSDPFDTPCVSGYSA